MAPRTKCFRFTSTAAYSTRVLSELLTSSHESIHGIPLFPLLPPHSLCSDGVSWNRFLGSCFMDRYLRPRAVVLGVGALISTGVLAFGEGSGSPLPTFPFLKPPALSALRLLLLLMGGAFKAIPCLKTWAFWLTICKLLHATRVAHAVFLQMQNQVEQIFCTQP